VRQTYAGTRAVVRWRSGGIGAVDLRGSLFCQVREPTAQPLCEFYAAAIRRLSALFELEISAHTDGCRGAGAPRCMIVLARRTAEAPAE
jgi:predicted hydrocarbon binding protein